MRDIAQWSPLEIRLSMLVANAPLYAFEECAANVGELVEFGLIARAEGADVLQTVATYNALVTEYGADRIQKIMADAFAPRKVVAA